MCGIFGYVGKSNKPAAFILDGLKTLEYRGYDSWGLVVLSSQPKAGPPLAENKLKRERHVGKIGEAKTVLPPTMTGMGHTRWATHGFVSVKNAHPHFDCQGRFAVVHNGIIENERELRKELTKLGHKFSSETDTEIIAHLLEEEAFGLAPVSSLAKFARSPSPIVRLSRTPGKPLATLGVASDGSSLTRKFANFANFDGAKPLLDLVRSVVGRLEGAFAIGVMDRDRPGELVLARMGGPLVAGMTDGYKLFSSDPSALLPFTKKVIYLQDRELAFLTPDNLEIRSFENHRKNPGVTSLDWDVEKTKKGGYPHFMLKEMMSQPLSLTDTLRGRIKLDGGVKLGGLESVTEQLRDIEFIRFIACGSAYYAGLFGASVIQELTEITATAEIASEYKYGNFNWPKKSTAWFISQSGETADVLGAIDKVKTEKILPLGLVNVVGSSVAQRTAAGVYLHAGPEVGVASTKAFMSQLAALAMIGVWLRQLKESYEFRTGYLVGGNLLVRRHPSSRHLSGLRASPAPDSVGVGVASDGSSLTRKFANFDSRINVKLVASELRNLPGLVKKVLGMRNELKKLAKEIITKRQIFFMGRGRNYPLALEGALKLREVAYLDTLGLPTGELKHGPIAAMDKNRPAILLAPSDGMEMKNRSSAQELRARKIPVYIVTDLSGKSKFSDVADRLIVIPDVYPILQPILLAPIVQLLAYEAGVSLGLPIDKPRNLAKSVTVE